MIWYPQKINRLMRHHDPAVRTTRRNADEYGFWFSEDVSKWFGNSSSQRMIEYRKRKKAGESMDRKKHPGVTFRRNGKFQAELWVNGKSTHIGYFETAELASEARQEAINKMRS